MKKTLVLTTIALLVSGSAAAKTWVLTNAEEGMDKGNWQINSDQLKVKDHAFSIEQKVLHGGKQEGSKILTIHSKDGLTITLSPTRGMNLLRIEGFGSRMGWDSPVKEVVNPAFINLESRNGLGWLEGFNEMMVRCGYEWTGHPVTADGQIYTLHGKAGNSFSLHDVLTNHADYPHDYQIIYHSNFGTPILEEGARFLAPMSSISPFNDYAKSGLKTWQTYQGPTKDFDEMVFNIQPLADENHQTLAAVVNKAGDKGASIQFDTRQLPVLTLWKNTDTVKQGYVTGIEPGTSYAYPVTIEREQKRVKQLQPGASAQFDLTYTLLHDSAQVAAVEQKIAKIQGDNKVAENETPIAKE